MMLFEVNGGEGGLREGRVEDGTWKWIFYGCRFGGCGVVGGNGKEEPYTEYQWGADGAAMKRWYI
jgi:hypothetical protein